MERCQDLIQHFHTQCSVQKLWFRDKKIFTVATPVNSQNDRVYLAADKKCYMILAA